MGTRVAPLLAKLRKILTALLQWHPRDRKESDRHDNDGNRHHLAGAVAIDEPAHERHGYARYPRSGCGRKSKGRAAPAHVVGD